MHNRELKKSQMHCLERSDFLTSGEDVHPEIGIPPGVMKTSSVYLMPGGYITNSNIDISYKGML